MSHENECQQNDSVNPALPRQGNRYYVLPAGILLKTPSYEAAEGPAAALTQKSFNLKVWIRGVRTYVVRGDIHACLRIVQRSSAYINFARISN